jgi:hypothetical protein
MRAPIGKTLEAIPAKRAALATYSPSAGKTVIGSAKRS